MHKPNGKFIFGLNFWIITDDDSEISTENNVLPYFPHVVNVRLLPLKCKGNSFNEYLDKGNHWLLWIIKSTALAKKVV